MGRNEGTVRPRDMNWQRNHSVTCTKHFSNKARWPGNTKRKQRKLRARLGCGGGGGRVRACGEAERGHHPHREAGRGREPACGAGPARSLRTGLEETEERWLGQKTEHKTLRHRARDRDRHSGQRAPGVRSRVLQEPPGAGRGGGRTRTGQGTHRGDAGKTLVSRGEAAPAGPRRQPAGRWPGTGH